MTAQPSATRPTGTSSNNVIDLVLGQINGANRRRTINALISADTNQSLDEANRPSAHLRWALQQMKLRGWRNDDWGRLFAEEGGIGDGPICLLEACGAAADAPSNVDAECPEQFYLRSAFVALGQEVPLYLSKWNDEQETFAPVETVLLKAIELAEADEAEGQRPWRQLTPTQLNERFGFTTERFEAARAAEETVN